MNFFENAVIFDKYQIIEKTGDGPVFSTYLGRSTETGDDVIIKMLNPGRYTRYEVDKICFNNELPTIKTFDHPNILRVLEAGSYSNTICIVTEYHPMINLFNFLKGRGALDVSVSLRIIQQLASALRYAHSRNILHRNLKSSNINIIEVNGEYDVKLADFGLSYIIDYGTTTSELVDEDFGFMAPESTGLLDHKIDVRSDLYSLGILMYRLLTGSYPFHADTIDNMVYQHVAVMPKNPAEYNPSIPDEVAKLVCKLLTKNPDQRYQTANELINDIDIFMAANIAGIRMHNEDLLQTMDQRSRIYSRKNELFQLRNLYSKALEGPGRFCLVKGSLGCGKSDLFANLCSELDISSIPYYRAHFTSQSAMTPYHAFHDILDSFVDVFDHYDRKLQITERSRLARTLTGLSELVFRICARTKKVLPESLALPTLEGYREQQRSIMLLSNFFLSMHSQGSPFVIILDDIHFADASSLALLCEMAEHISEYKVFIVCSCRDSSITDSSYLSTFLETCRKQELFSEISLDAFSEDRMCEYLSDLLILDKDECQELASYIVERTAGNPYFAVNVLRSMLEEGLICVSNGILEQNWEQLRSINQADDINKIIERRMSRLDEDAITVLEIAAVIGESFSLNLIGILTDLGTDELTELLSKAVSMQFVEYSSTCDILEFSHRDIHSVFISRITDEYRRYLHYWIGRALELILPSTVSDSSSLSYNMEVYKLVYHFTEAGSDSDVRRYILNAASLAKLSNANEEAIGYYNQALRLIEAEGGAQTEDWVIAKHSLVELNLTVGNFDEAIACADVLLPHMSDNVDRAQLLHKIALGYYRQSSYQKCESLLREALGYLGERFPSSDFALKCDSARLKLRYSLVRRVVADPTADRHESDKDTHIPEIIVSILETLCWVYAYSDVRRFDYVALRTYFYVSRHFGISRQLATALSIMGIYNMQHGHEKDCDECQMLALKVRNELKDDYGLGRSQFFTGFVLMRRSNVSRSIKNFSEAMDSFSAIGDLWEVNNARGHLARAYLMTGDYTKCEALCNRCIEESRRLKDGFALVMAYANLISCLTEIGNFANAEEVARQARPSVEALDMPYASAIFNLAYGRLLLELQKYSDAITVLTKAQDGLEHSGINGEYAPTVYGYLALAKIHLLNRDRLSLGLNEVQNREFDINSLCEKALAVSKTQPAARVVAFRAAALLGILAERFKKTDIAYERGAELTTSCEYHYENALLEYEYGQYLLSKHKNNEARFYVFEAYMTFANISSQFHLKACESIISEKYQEAFRNNALLTDLAARRNRMNVDRKVNTLLRLGDRLTSTLELDELQRKILQDAVELVGAERGILFLYPESGEKRLYVASLYNLGNFDCNTYDWMLEEVERNRKPIVINDVQSDEYRKHYSVMARYGIKSVMAMPMFVRGSLFGVIYLDSRLVRQIFTDDYIEAMTFIANQGGAPIENARLYHRAITDGLTGIYGRSYLDNLIVDRIANIDNVPLSAIMIDVDNFKRCNDTYGHPFGDKVLKQIAGIMKRVAGDNGVPCRYGGEEFVVILNSGDPDFVYDIADKIRQTVENSTMACNTGSEVTLVSVTISLGVSIWDSSMERVDLIEHADKALYYAKTHGKNQVVLWNEELQ